MTFYELLKKYSMEELWYILRDRHALANKPVKAARMFFLYKSAREELLALHSPDNPTDNILICNLEPDIEKNDIYVHCKMLSTTESGEKTEYAIDYVPWRELIDCNILEESIAKLGELICAAELLWEVTFHGFSEEKVAQGADDLHQLIADIESGDEKTYPMNLDDLKPRERTKEDAYIKGWFVNAPNAVKNMIHDFFVGKNENETPPQTIQRLADLLDTSTAKTDDSELHISLLHAMLEELDIDNAHTLLCRMFPQSDGEIDNPLDVYDDPPAENLQETEFYIQGFFDYGNKRGGYQLLMVFGNHMKFIEDANLEGASDVSMILDAIIVGLNNLKKPCSVTVFSNTLFGMNDLYRKGKLRKVIRPKAANYERKERIRLILREHGHVLDNLQEKDLRTIIKRIQS